MPVFVGYQVDSKPQVTEPARTTDPVKVGLTILGKVKIDDDIHRLNVNPPREQVYMPPTGIEIK